jgi:hypothetical protein
MALRAVSNEVPIDEGQTPRSLGLQDIVDSLDQGLLGRPRSISLFTNLQLAGV